MNQIDSASLRRRRTYPYLFESLGREVALTVLSLKPGEHALEIGLGGGERLLQIATLVGAQGRATGVDPSPEALELTEARLREVAYGNFALHQGAPTALPVEAASCDAVYCTYVFDGLPGAQIVRALEEVRRVLRPGGRAALCGLTQGERLWSRAVSGGWHTLARAWPSLTRHRQPRLLQEDARAAGFEIDRRLYLEQRGVPSEVLLLVRPRARGLDLAS